MTQQEKVPRIVRVRREFVAATIFLALGAVNDMPRFNLLALAQAVLAALSAYFIFEVTHD